MDNTRHQHAVASGNGPFRERSTGLRGRRKSGEGEEEQSALSLCQGSFVWQPDDLYAAVETAAIDTSESCNDRGKTARRPAASWAAKLLGLLKITRRLSSLSSSSFRLLT